MGLPKPVLAMVPVKKTIKRTEQAGSQVRPPLTSLLFVPGSGPENPAQPGGFHLGYALRDSSKAYRFHFLWSSPSTVLLSP